MPTITLIRHAETEANLAGIWNGRTDGPLSASGEASLDPLGQRLGGVKFDIVVSSPLQRARQTAGSLASEVLVDEDLIEGDAGQWEGVLFADIMANEADQLREMISDRDTPIGYSGETLNQVSARAVGAVRRIADQVGETGHAAVVSHGGALQSVIDAILPGRRRRFNAFLANTSITRIEVHQGRIRLAVLNDTAHLGSLSAEAKRHIDEGTPVLALIRHGRTLANVERRWQGQGDWGLDDVGSQQAEALAGWYGRVAHGYSSPLGRAHQTAGYLVTEGIEKVDHLMEIDMGRWEGLTTDEIVEADPELMRLIYRHGVDLKRGHTGESWGELSSRVGNALRGLEPTPGAPTVVVAHGGAIRAFVSSFLPGKDTHGETLFTPANTSVSHVVLTEDGPLLLDYGVAPHLERLDG